MTTAAAFTATFSDWKLVRTRKCVQLVFEVPVEQSGRAYDVLGGMPDPSKSIWCAIARLNEGATEGQATLDDTSSAPPRTAEPVAPITQPQPSAQSRSWRDLTYAQQAGIRCSEKSFQRFLQEKIAPDADFDSCTTQAAIDLAASIVRHRCIVRSRSDIRPNHPSGRQWRELDEAFSVWMQHPEFA